MRRLRPMLALVVAAALCTPLPALHVHRAHDADHHPLVHAHFGVHNRANLPTSSLAEHDADAAYVDAVASLPPTVETSVQRIALAVDAPVLTSPASLPFISRDRPEASVHDPPFSNCGLRAPPIFPV